MENYIKPPSTEIEVDNGPLPFQDLPDDLIHLRIKRSTKLRNILGFGLKEFQKPEPQHLICSATGSAITKAITCCEIIKRNHKECHQITKIRFFKVLEIWKPKESNLDQIKVERDIPSIHILLCKMPLDQEEPGYQAPGNYNSFWQAENAPLKTAKRKYNQFRIVAGRKTPNRKGGANSAFQKEGKRKNT